LVEAVFAAYSLSAVLKKMVEGSANIVTKLCNLFPNCVAIPFKVPREDCF